MSEANIKTNRMESIKGIYHKDLFIYSFICSFIYLFIYLFIIYLFIYLFEKF